LSSTGSFLLAQRGLAYQSATSYVLLELAALPRTTKWHIQQNLAVIDCYLMMETQYV
jgi:hypothetical protein